MIIHHHGQPPGTAPALVLLHGWAMHAGIFAPLLPRLRDHFCIHAVDLPGHGHSQPADMPLLLETVADALAERLPRAHVLGWSLGGQVALQLAASHPQQVERLVVTASNPCFVAREDWPHGMPADTFDEFARGLEQDVGKTIERFLALEVFQSSNAAGQLRELHQALATAPMASTQSLREGLALLRGDPLRARLPGIRQPCLWLAGRRDRLVPWQAMAAAAERMPDARIEVLAGAGHAPFIGAPEAFTELVLGFLTAKEATA